MTGKGPGWHNDNQEHALASKGIKTSDVRKKWERMATLKDKYDTPEKKRELIEHVAAILGAKIIKWSPHLNKDGRIVATVRTYQVHEYVNGNGSYLGSYFRESDAKNIASFHSGLPTTNNYHASSKYTIIEDHSFISFSNAIEYMENQGGE